jgi:hypothetical protein
MMVIIIHKKDDRIRKFMSVFCLWISNDTRAHIYTKEIMLLLQLCSMTWLPVKRSFFFSIRPACDVVHGHNIKRKERKRKKEREKKRAAARHSEYPSG